jgi:2-polyprenyl-3-methyl-5-hydroxy-6-metoxy-1,4-benzoquinol methylase
MMNVEQRHERQRTGEAMLNFEIQKMKDLFGKAILDYQIHNSPEDLITETSISEADEMSVAYLFRSYAEMPKLEQKALQLAKGKVLDVGCGAGSHSLFLQEQGFDVTSIDISTNAIEACRLRGVKNARVQNVLEIENEKFDTIILLMNGTGIFGTLKETSKYLQKLKSLLNPNGQILIDSSDIIYMFDQDEDGAYDVPANGYYGELTFTIAYKNEEEDPFPWLYLDYNTLQNAANANSLQCELIMEGEHFDYLARLFT